MHRNVITSSVERGSHVLLLCVCFFLFRQTTGNFIFRSREFEMAELEWFCYPQDDEKWFEFWKEKLIEFFTGLG